VVHLTDMLNGASIPFDENGDVLVRCIEACFDCAQTCTTCADGCLAEMPSEMRACIAKCTTCGDVCATTGRVLSRPGQGWQSLVLIQAIVTACIESCRICLAECASHPGMQRCRICAEVCRRCEQACNELLTGLQLTT
jgi:hypothetical protein